MRTSVKFEERAQPGEPRPIGQAVRGVAVIGTGSIGMRHLETLRALEGIRPIAIPRRAQRLTELRNLGFAAAKDLDEAVAVGATVCIIATETGQHVEDALAAIRAGLDVLVEKPLATEALAVHKVLEAARAAQCLVFVGCVLRFSESLNMFRARLPQVGRLHAVRIECQSYLPDWRPERPYRDSCSARADEGGVLRDLIHEIDYAGWIFGWPRAVQAQLRNLGRLGIAAEETADLLWETDAGCLVSVSLDYLSQPARRGIRALGEQGTLEWDGVRNTVTCSLVGADAEVISSRQSRDEMFREQAKAFLSAEQGSTDERLATGEDGVRALAVCDAARRASASRREERVGYP